MAVAQQPATQGSPFEQHVVHPAGRHAAASGGSHLAVWLVGVCVVAVVAIISPLVALGMYQYEHRGKVYQGVSVLGIDLSGRTRDEAQQLVSARSAELTARAVLVRAGDTQWRTDWGKLGLSLPVQTVVDRAMAVGRQGTILDQLYAQARALRGGRTVLAEETLDVAPIKAFADGAAAQVDRPVRNARLEMLPDLTFEMTTARAGRRLDPDEAVRLLVAAAQRGDAAVDLPVTTLNPLTTDEMRLPAKTKAEQILDGPVTVKYAERAWTIDRQALADLLLFSGGAGVPIEVRLDGDKLRPRIQQIAAELYQEPKDAELTWANGALQATRPSQEGRSLDVDVALKQALAGIEAGQREIVLTPTVTKPKLDSTNLQALGIKELVNSATTSFVGALPQKQHNVRLAASRLNDKLIAPGETFSFNKVLGPTTLDNGYQIAFGIMGTGGSEHKTVPSVAGGICQVATTLFQPVFWSGYQIEERHWHLYWIPNYSSKGVVGLDATVDEETGLDLQFVNNSSTYLLLESRTDDSSVTFELYGTKPSWDVKVDGPKMTDPTKADPTPVVEREPSLPAGQQYQVEAARDGFTATFVRTVTSADSPARTLRLESKYVPSRNVTLVGTGGQPVAPPAAAPTVGHGA
ncbi:MAG: VanW family protein [Chloroflexota bacterium]